jgi:aspartate racemase
MNEYKLGIIGGLGPKATSIFYDLLVDLTKAHRDQEHINTVILSHASLPDRTESVLGGNGNELRDKLIKDAKLLERIGVNSIAIPCNTSHYFFKDIQSSGGIKVINMIEESVIYVKYKNGGNVTKLGVLATDGTVKTDIYGKECKKNSIEVVYPTQELQSVVMDVIYNDVKGNNDFSKSMDRLNPVIQYLKDSGCNGVILGCTELSVVFHDNRDVYIYDSLKILAKSCVEYVGLEINDRYEKGFF